MWFRIVICCGLILAALSGTHRTTAAPDPIRARIDAMTLEEKVGQLFLITLYSPELGPSDRALIEAIHPGGVVLFPHNIQSPEQVARLTNDLQAYAQEVGPDVPLLIAVDQEGGRVSRLLDGFTLFPSPLVLGATASRADAVALGQAMGQELAAVGITMDLAPVVDLHYPAHDSGDWEVMYRRTISADPALVGMLAGGMVEGLRAAGVIGVLKHFPGHGAAQADSHNELPVIPLTREETEATALAAFAGAIDAGASAVMVGHLYYPALDPVERPASISPAVIGVLRGELGFTGVTVSDAMQMGGVRADHEIADAVVEAISAGIDLITFGPIVFGQVESARAVIDAVQSGRLSEDRIDEAVSRVLALREEYDLMEWSPVDDETAGQRVGGTTHEDVLYRLALDAVTVVHDDPGLLGTALLPLDPADQIAVIFPGMYANIGRACAEIDPDVIIREYTLNPTESDEFIGAAHAAREADRVVIFIDDLVEHPDQIALVKVLPPEKTIVVNMNMPGQWDLLPPDIAAYVLTYQSSPEARIAACRVLYGAAPAQGDCRSQWGPTPSGRACSIDAVRPTTDAGMP